MGKLVYYSHKNQANLLKKLFPSLLVCFWPLYSLHFDKFALAYVVVRF